MVYGGVGKQLVIRQTPSSRAGTRTELGRAQPQLVLDVLLNFWGTTNIISLRCEGILAKGYFHAHTQSLIPLTHGEDICIGS